MSRFYTIGDAGTEDVVAHPYRTHQGPGVLKIGAQTVVDPTSMPGTLVSVGLTDNTISLNPNIETSAVTSAQIFGPYNLVETGWNFQITAALDEVDVWNLALAFSYDVSETVAASSSVLTPMGGQHPSPFRGVRLTTAGPASLGSDSAATARHTHYNFWKCKIVPNGDIPFAPDTKTTLPVMIHALHNADDQAGDIAHSVAIVSPSYE